MTPYLGKIFHYITTSWKISLHINLLRHNFSSFGLAFGVFLSIVFRFRITAPRLPRENESEDLPGVVLRYVHRTTAYFRDLVPK